MSNFNSFPQNDGNFHYYNSQATQNQAQGWSGIEQNQQGQFHGMQVVYYPNQPTSYTNNMNEITVYPLVFGDNMQQSNLQATNNLSDGEDCAPPNTPEMNAISNKPQYQEEDHYFFVPLLPLPMPETANMPQFVRSTNVELPPRSSLAPRIPNKDLDMSDLDLGPVLTQSPFSTTDAQVYEMEHQFQIFEINGQGE
ncbi:hypothetical protein [Pseudochelatococcus sp. G4_1912]|uniref:hypothetical protein n=1 Tax=Pseudochelatococcus sp. G4_1912 TaxID=3114288 RepID=UPI0039C691FA